MWYQIVPEADGTITASTAGSTISGGDVFDTVLAAYLSSLAPATPADQSCNDDTGDTTSRIHFDVSAGQKYYLQLGGYGSGADAVHGTFRLCISLNNDGACTAPAEPTAEPTATTGPTSTTGPTDTPTPDWTATPTPIWTNTPTPIGTGVGTNAGTGNVTAAKSGTAIAQTGAGPSGANPAITGPGRGTSGTGGPGGAGNGAPGDVSLASTQMVVSAFTPSITWFSLPSGYQLSVTLDPAAIAALQAALPNVAQVLIVFDPAPTLLNEVQRGSLGGGNVTPAGLPFALTLVPKDSDGNAVTPVASPDMSPADAYARALAQVQVQLSLPVLPSEAAPNGVFAWLQAVYDSAGFEGYLRSAATFIAPGTTAGPAGATSPFGAPDPLGLAGTTAYPATGAGDNTATLKASAGALDATPESTNPLGMLRLRFSMVELQGTLFLPAALTPAYVANFDGQAHIFSSPFGGATDYGLAGPQYTTFTVVAPQVAGRLYVYDPVTDNYGWIDVAGVGPVTPPSE